MTDERELKHIYDMFSDCWRFFKKYADARDTIECWQPIVNEAAEINERYDCEFCKDLLIATQKELERIGKRRKSENEKAQCRI